MPTTNWLKKEFHYGYDSGDILTLFPDTRRREEQRKCGGSYRRVFNRAVKPYLSNDSVVLELGPGAGSWTRAILARIPAGKLLAVDFQDSARWLRPENYHGRLECIQVEDNSFREIPDSSVDFFWSFGVLCHNNLENIETILGTALVKMKPGGYSAHQYGDWDKLDRFGWEKGGIPPEFKDRPDTEIWWPRNSAARMEASAKKAGWHVVNKDLGLLGRDGLVLLRRPV